MQIIACLCTSNVVTEFHKVLSSDRSYSPYICSHNSILSNNPNIFIAMLMTLYYLSQQSKKQTAKTNSCSNSNVAMVIQRPGEAIILFDWTYKKRYYYWDQNTLQYWWYWRALQKQHFVKSLSISFNLEPAILLPLRKHLKDFLLSSLT